MFRSRSKEADAPAATPAQEERSVRDPQAPKGRPTPKRSEAEAQRRAARKPPADRKEAARRAREQRREALARQREALLTGDERHLPARDRGRVRRYVRDFVDAKFHVAEFFLPIAVAILVLSMLPWLAARNLALLLWLVVIIMIVLDSVLMTRRLRRELRDRFPGENLRGTSSYALMRSLQMRRMRLPRPQIKRGESPR